MTHGEGASLLAAHSHAASLRERPVGAYGNTPLCAGAVTPPHSNPRLGSSTMDTVFVGVKQ
jgi:hypothetical protein